MNVKFICFIRGHKWQVKYSTERKDLCKCSRCGDTAHFDREPVEWSRKHGKLVRR